MSNLKDHILDCNNDYGHIIVVEDLENELGVNMTNKGTNLYSHMFICFFLQFMYKKHF